MADGNIVLTIDAETGKATKEVARLEKKVDALGKRVERLGSQIDKGFEKLGDDVSKVRDSVDDVADSIDEGLAAALGDLRAQMDATLGTTETGFEKIERKIDGVKETVASVNDQFGNFGEEAKGHLSELDPGFGKMIKGFKGMTTGLKQTGTGFSFLGKAVAMSGLGLLLTLLGSLVSYFKETEQGAAMMEKAMAVLQIPMKVVGKIAETIGEALVFAFTEPQAALDAATEGVKGLWEWMKTLAQTVLIPYQIYLKTLKLGFLEAAAGVKEFFGGDATALQEQIAATHKDITDLTNEMAANGKKLAQPFVDAATATGNAFAKQWQKIVDKEAMVALEKEAKKMEVEMTKAEARINQEISKRKAILDDERATYAEKSKALDEQLAMEQELLEMQIAQMRVEEQSLAMAAKLAKGEEKIEAEQELAEAMAERIGMETELNELLTDFANQRTELALDEVERKRDIEELLADATADARKDTIANNMKTDLEDLNRQKEADIRELKELRATKEQIADMEESYRRQELRLREDYARELREQEAEIVEMLRDARGDYGEKRLSDEHALQQRELDMARQAAKDELDQMGADQQAYLDMELAFAEQREDLNAQQAKERAKQARAAADLVAQAEMDAYLMGVSLMSNMRGERDKLELEADQARRMAILAQNESDAIKELEELEATEEQKQAIRDHYSEMRVQEEKRAAQEVRDLNKRQFAETFGMYADAGSDIIGLLQDRNDQQEAETLASAKRQFERNKRMQKAQAIIAGAQGVVNQLAVPQDALTGANFVKAAIVAATTAANIAKINSTSFDSSPFQVDDGSRGGGGNGVQIQAVDLSFLNRDQESAEPLRAYVVNQEVQNAAMQQQLIENKVNFS
jgi:hypothetical protein